MLVWKKENKKDEKYRFTVDPLKDTIQKRIEQNEVRKSKIENLLFNMKVGSTALSAISCIYFASLINYHKATHQIPPLQTYEATALLIAGLSAYNAIRCTEEVLNSSLKFKKALVTTLSIASVVSAAYTAIPNLPYHMIALMATLGSTIACWASNEFL
jgi:hypothetical protein